MKTDRVEELLRDLIPILKPTHTHSRYSSATRVSMVQLQLPYPFSYSTVQQAALLLDTKEVCSLDLTDKRVAVLEVARASSEDSDSGREDSDSSDTDCVPRTDIDLSYFKNDKSLKACIESLYKLFNGIRIFADRRNTTDEYCTLIIDGATVIRPHTFQQMCTTLAHFVYDVQVIGQKRFNLKCRFTRASRKRKRLE